MSHVMTRKLHNLAAIYSGFLYRGVVFRSADLPLRLRLEMYACKMIYNNVVPAFRSLENVSRERRMHKPQIVSMQQMELERHQLVSEALQHPRQC